MQSAGRSWNSAHKFSTQKTKKIVIPVGWDTTDADEINRRRERAATEAMQVVLLDDVPYFGTYAVRTGSGNAYRVEMRSLDALLNSCDCADYDTNRLGTCKHIEKVRLSLEKKGMRKFRAAEASGNRRIEVYVHEAEECVKVFWPEPLTSALTQARALLAPFFSADGQLIADIATALPAIERTVQDAPEEVQQCIRLSHRLSVARQRTDASSHKHAARENFLKDVQDGKRDLDVTALPLYPYQQQGMLHLAFGERAILADEMGLGKTVQAVAACELLRRLRGVRKVLVVATTSLKSEWEEQIGKFSTLPSVIIRGSRPERLRQYRQDAFFFLTNYEQVMRDHDDIQQNLAPDVIILDEAQRIKNWRAKTSATIKSLKSRYAFVLTGTPIENRIDDIYSIVQFLDPQFFGPLFRFNREFYQCDEKGKPVGYKNLDVLHQRLKPILLRRRKEEVEGELPERTVNNYFVQMTEEQTSRYADFEMVVAKLAAVARRRALLEPEFLKLQKSLAGMRMLCDTPYILDEECRICPKLEELDSIFDELLADEHTKIIIFSEWERMLMLVRERLTERSVGYAWHTGSVDQKKRPQEIQRFKNDPACRIFLSTDAGSVGLNLQAANVVINLDLPWNPAKLEQRIARAWRKHQRRSVQVINLISEHTIEHRMLGLLSQKQALADNVLESGDTASMDMPSGRTALMERLNEVLGQSSSDAQRDTAEKAENPAKDPLSHFREEAVARLASRLELCEVYENAADGTRTVLAVVNGDNAEPREIMCRALMQADPQQSLRLEVLDKATYDTIQRLCQAGVLSLHADHATLLHRMQAAGNKEKDERQKRLQAAQRFLKESEHKLRLGTVLAGSGFFEEACRPLQTALEKALHAMAAFCGHAADEDAVVPITLLEKELITKEGLPPQTLSLVARLREDATPADENAIGDMTHSVQTICQHIEERIHKAILSCAA